MDIRKPGLNKVFNLSHRAEGITNYLSDPDHVKLTDMIQRSDISRIWTSCRADRCLPTRPSW